MAASEGNLHIVEVLIEHSVEVNCKDRWDSTPLSDALRANHLELARLLIKHGGLVAYDELTAAGELCEFARAGKVENIECLLDGRCNIDACDCDLLPLELWISHHLQSS